MIVHRKGGSLAACLRRFALGCSLAAIAIPAGTAARAQQTGETPPRPEQLDGDVDASAVEIVVTGNRRSIIGAIAPLATFDENAIAATGATTMGELLRAIRGVTQSADGGEPIFLLNSQRVSGYQEIGSLPPEAIEKVEALPEQAALQFGYPPTRRVVNFITKRRFRQVEVRGTLGTTTDGGSAMGNANLGITRLHGDSRLTATLEYRHTDPLFQSDRDLLPDPDILFDAIGNVAGVGGGEIDPALSEAAGHVVTIARVPDALAARATLAGFAAGADRPRLFDLGPYRTLVARNDAVKGELVLADRIGRTLAGSISISAERSRDHTLGGPALATLNVPATNGFSPFTRPVLLYRYLSEVDPLRQSQTTTTLHAGGLLRGAVAGWRWDLTGALDQQETSGRNERGIDVTAANAAIAAGANPFVPLDPALLAARLVDRVRVRTRTAGAKAVATNAPVRLPAGEVTVTASVEAERATADSTTRGPAPFDLHLARTRMEASLAIDVPLASRREDVFPWLGEVSVNASAAVRHVGGFGALYDTSYGASWTPITGVQLLATVKRSATAPAMAQRSFPEVRVENAAFFDFRTGRTELVTLFQGGNPDLAAERRRIRSLALNIKPFAKPELRVSATYEATTILDQTGTVYAVTPQTEAILPELFTRDASGRLTSAAFRPINFHRQRQRTLNVTINSYGTIGKAPPPAKPGDPPGRQRPNFYAGMGPSFKFSDRLQLRPGAPELDVLRGDTITGGGTSRAYGYAYGGISHFGNGLTFDAWYGGASRVRSANPAADLSFSSIFKVNMGAYVSVHHFLPQEEWTRKVQLKVEISNLTNDRQRVTDGNGRVPNRFQPDYLDPIRRTVKATLRKLF